MRTRGMVVAGCAVLLVSAPLPAQTPGTLELGTFGRYSRLDSRGLFDDALGLSGRIGIFVLPGLSLELDVSRARVEDSQGVRSDFTPVHARALYSRPVGARTDLLLGLGYAQFDYGNTDQVPGEEFGIGALAGLRIALGERAAFRLDGTVDVMSVLWNDNRGRFVRQPDGRRVATFRGRTHLGLQAGVSLLWNMRRRRVESPIPARAEPAPAAQDTAAQPAAPQQPAVRAAQPAQPAAPDRAAEAERARARAILEEIVYFDYDRALIRAEAQDVLGRKLEVLRANPDVMLRIEGHADERGSTEYNLALGQRRANAVRDQLVRLGVPPSQLEALSMGESRPIDPGRTQQAWARNRRAEFSIVRGGETLRMPAR